MHDQLHGLITDDNHQFGFKKDHSTGLCTIVFKETVDYYRRNGSHVFACFVILTRPLIMSTTGYYLTGLLTPNVH